MTALLIVLAIVLAVTNALTVTALVLAHRRAQYRRPAALRAAPDPALSAVLAVAPSPTGTAATAGTRRIISIEILNPIELAGHRNRVFGIAGSFVPDLTRRLVHDQTARRLRDQLGEHRVVADVRVHTIPSRTDAARTDAVRTAAGVALVQLSPQAHLDTQDVDVDLAAEEPTRPG